MRRVERSAHFLVCTGSKMAQRKTLPQNPVEILLVEDNPGDIRLIQEAFKEGGVSSRLNIARDGEQALAFLRREGSFSKSPRPAIILLDLNLPRKDGREVLAEIKKDKALRQIPVVILSTSTAIEDVHRAYDLHANCYVSKPLDVETLVQLGKSLEEFWLSTAILPA
ncbi:MAG TPA: response regulator [Bryobacteraceae bacterium]|nr:response regulator [Bryobacteraceae bacterium]